MTPTANVNNEAPKTILLANARVILADRIAETTSLLIEGGRIARISTSSAAEFSKIDAIDLDGLTLFPGFIDIHIHGAVGVDMLEANAEGLARIAEFLAGNGTTAWLPTLVPASPEQYQRAIEAISGPMNESSSHGARIIGAHYEGPFVNSEQCGALHREHFRTFANLGELDTLPTIRHPAAIHFMTIAPEIEGGIALVTELTRRGWIVSIGHTRATPHILDQAIEAGAHHMTHFMNAMPPLHHRAPGPVGWGLTRDEVTCDVIADGVHLDPSILKLIIRSKSSDRISLISDAIAATGLGDGDYQVWGERIQVENGRTRNDRGSIAGSVITMLDAVRMMLSLGVSEPEVARMASLNPARLLGISGDCGSIEEGKRADLVALDRDGNVRLTIIGGQRIG